MVLENKKYRFEARIINGIPFCRFLGNQGSIKKTWFFFVGFRKKENNKILLVHGKSMIDKGNEVFYFGEHAWEYITQNSLHEIIDFRRFGDLEKLCISSRLGGGIWNELHGQKLKSWLEKFYPNYFYLGISKLGNV